MTKKVVGILNCTPDSFSDGHADVSLKHLFERAHRMIDEGADILDIGGDSTRPGSTCPGIEEEWRRISPLITKLSPVIPISVDTHHSEVARRAIECGASFINDISGTRSTQMLQVIAPSTASYIFMYNPHGGAHLFGDGLSVEGAVSDISEWIEETHRLCVDAGIDPSRLIADPGMGAFLSVDPVVSWSVVEEFGKLPHPPGGLLLGCSRKGFLNVMGELDIETKDRYSARIGAAAAHQVPEGIPTYLRVHNVALQRQALRGADVTMPNWRAHIRQ
ncbi:MAG: hypothetical protein RL518_1656 [Pseudomonadota bacterium]|jgi:dihydropteroate synthase